MMSRLLNYVRRIGRWAGRDLMPFWRPMAVIAMVLVATHLLPLPGEQQLRLAGLALQIAGLTTVAHGLNLTRAAFNLKGVRAAMWDALRAIPRWKRSVNMIAGTASISLAGATASLRGTVKLRADATTEEKLQALTTQVENLSNAVHANQEKLKAESNRLTQALAGEARERAGEDEKTRNLLRQALTGGLVLEATGLLWLLVGIVLATLSTEILHLLP